MISTNKPPRVKPKQSICEILEIVLEGETDGTIWEIDITDRAKVDEFIQFFFPNEANKLSDIDKIMKVVDETGDIEEVRVVWDSYFECADSSGLSKERMCRDLASFVVTPCACEDCEG